jgi:hypothetical protein
VSNPSLQHEIDSPSSLPRRGTGSARAFQIQVREREDSVLAPEPLHSVPHRSIARARGQWNVITRNIANDIPSVYQPSDFSGASLTFSLSFAGGNSTDKIYVGSVYFG